MTQHATGTRQEWLAARLKLLDAEKELTRRSDELARQRQALPWVRLDKQYRFDTDEGSASLADLFRGRSQLLVYHFMFGPDYNAGCPACSAIADGFNGFAVHLANHDVMLWAISRAPLQKLQAFKRADGMVVPVGILVRQRLQQRFRRRGHAGAAARGRPNTTTAASPPSCPRNTQVGAEPTKGAEISGTDVPTYIRERPGMSAFALEDGVVYHTYSAYARGLDGLWGAYQWLDRTPKGRNEPDFWWRHHDKYDQR